MPVPGNVLVVQDLRDFLDVQGTGKATALDDALTGAFVFSERYTRRRFVPWPLTSGDPVVTFTARADGLRFLHRLPDARSLATVVADGVTLTSADYLLHGHPGPDDPAAIIELAAAAAVVVVTGRFGFTPLPGDLRDSILTLAARRYNERQLGGADARELPEGGIVSYFRSLPAPVKSTLELYRRAEAVVA